MNATILQSATDPVFALRSFSQYAQEKASGMSQFYADFLAAMTESSPSIALTKMQDAGWAPSAKIWISSAVYVSVNDLVNICWSQLEETTDPATYADDFVISQNVTWNEFVEYFQNALFETTALGVAASISPSVNFADKISFFRAKLQGVFSSEYTSVASVTQYFLEAFNNTHDAPTFWNSIISYSGLSRSFADNDDLLNIRQEVDALSYTGASPLSGLSFPFGDLKNAGSVVLSAANLAVQTIASIGSSIASGIGKIFSKFRRTFADPMDLEMIDDDAAPTIADLYHVRKSGSFNLTMNTATHGQGECYFHHEDWFKSPLANIKLKQWYKFDLISGTILIRCNQKPVTQSARNYDPSWHDADDRYLLFSDIDVCFKPKVLDGMDPWASFGSHTTYDYAQGLNAAWEYSVYATGDTNEVDRAMGLYRGILDTSAILHAAVSEMAGTTDSDLPFPNYGGAYPSSVTNADFFFLATGQGTPTWPNFSIKGALDQIAFDALYALVYHYKDKHSNPTSYQWVPYLRGFSTFESSAWRVKTDKENQDAAANFIRNAIVLVAVSTAAIVVGVKVFKAVRSAKISLTSTIKRLENKMANGEKLTVQDQKSYLKATRKLQRLSNASSAFANVTSSITPEDTSLQLTIQRAITG